MEHEIADVLSDDDSTGFQLPQILRQHLIGRPTIESRELTQAAGADRKAQSICTLHLPWKSTATAIVVFRIRAGRGSGEAWIGFLNIKFSHREAEDPQEPLQTWLDVKRIDGISDFAEFGEIHTFPSSSFSFVFNYFRMAFCVHSLRVHAFMRGLPERRGNEMQSGTTCRARSSSSPSPYIKEWMSRERGL